MIGKRLAQPITQRALAIRPEVAGISINQEPHHEQKQAQNLEN